MGLAKNWQNGAVRTANGEAGISYCRGMEKA